MQSNELHIVILLIQKQRCKACDGTSRQPFSPLDVGVKELKIQQHTTPYKIMSYCRRTPCSFMRHFVKIQRLSGSPETRGTFSFCGTPTNSSLNCTWFVVKKVSLVPPSLNRLTNFDMHACLLARTIYGIQ